MITPRTAYTTALTARLMEHFYSTKAKHQIRTTCQMVVVGELNQRFSYRW